MNVVDLKKLWLIHFFSSFVNYICLGKVVGFREEHLSTEALRGIHLHLHIFST